MKYFVPKMTVFENRNGTYIKVFEYREAQKTVICRPKGDNCPYALRRALLKRILLTVLLLGACNPLTTGHQEPLAQMTFAHIRPWPVYVASYEPVPFSGQVALPAGFAADPAVLVHDYLQSRFAASGSQGKLRMIVQDIAVTHTKTESPHKWGTMLGVNTHDHYMVRAGVKIELYNDTGGGYSGTTLTAHRDIRIPEHASPVERERAQMEALDHLIDDLDIAIRKVLKDDFSLF